MEARLDSLQHSCDWQSTLFSWAEFTLEPGTLLNKVASMPVVHCLGHTLTLPSHSVQMWQSRQVLIRRLKFIKVTQLSREIEVCRALDHRGKWHM